jgi:mRNA degradation ribonuclease J1/J2
MRIEKSNIHFDFFKEEGRHFFLSHFHSDHTEGLSRKWRKGKLYASEITSNLLKGIDKIDKKNIEVLYEKTPYNFVDNNIPYEVTPLNANHCFGALMYILKHEDAKTLFTGDFRYDKSFENYQDFLRDVNTAYIDNTYLDPAYNFPSAQESIEKVLDVISKYLSKKRIIIASYNIGKEKILISVAKEFGIKLYTPPEKLRYYRYLGIDEFFTKDKEEACVFVYNAAQLGHFFKLNLADDLMIIPRGFSLTKKTTEGKIYYIPYSEHSSYDEIMSFISMLPAAKLFDLKGKKLQYQTMLF